MKKFVYLAAVVLIVLMLPVAGNYRHFERKTNYLPDYSTEIFLPAIDENGKGAPVKLTVETKEGNDRILTNIDKLLFWVDTQESIQIAKSVAKDRTDIDTYNIDMIYTLEGNNATIVGGPSAGAALAVASVSALEQKPLNKSIMLTGTIDKNGTIGVVGAIEQKAEAAKNAGATLFLVPEGSMEKTRTEAVKTCESAGEYCEIVYKEVEFDLSDEVGIEIKEIKDIEEALKYFNL